MPLIDVLIELFCFHKTFISKLLVLNCQCSGPAPALYSYRDSADFCQYKVEVKDVPIKLAALS